MFNHLNFLHKVRFERSLDEKVCLSVRMRMGFYVRVLGIGMGG